jgi:DNA-binding NtrC family response regulator
MPSLHDSGRGPLSVFVVEDEALVALNLEDMLADLGCSIVGPAMRVDRARAMIEGGMSADVAILDVNVAGEQVFPIAEMLAARGVPIVFATGYDRDGLPEAWHGRTILQKPYTLDDVSRSLKAAVDGKADA